MPRKNPGSTVTADGIGNVSALATTPSEKSKQPSPKQQKDQGQTQEKPPKKKSDADAVTLDDLLLPRTLINRIARGVLPANTSIQRDAVLALTKSATVFISHLAAEANEMTDRKTIQSGDVLKALQEIEFAQVMNLGVMGEDGKKGGRIEREIEVWENNTRGKRRGYRDKVKARESEVGADTTMDSNTIANADDGEERQNKRQKRDSSEEVSIGEVGKSNAEDLGTTMNGTDKMVVSKTVTSGPEDDAVDEDEPEDLDETEDEEEDEQLEEEEEGDEQEETQDREDSVDVDETSRRKLLVPDGRIEAIGSDDESE